MLYSRIIANVKSNTWFDHLPTEIIFLIFDYLSNNEIIHTFFFFSQRLNNLLLQNQYYSRYLELPTTYLTIWKNILSVISSQVEYLNITTIYLTLPLSIFSNLKSIIISSSYGFPEEQLQLIFESEQFQNLISLKVKENQIDYNGSFKNYSTNENYILQKKFFIRKIH